MPKIRLLPLLCLLLLFLLLLLLLLLLLTEEGQPLSIRAGWSPSQSKTSSSSFFQVMRWLLLFLERDVETENHVLSQKARFFLLAEMLQAG
jgi:hypothetical protein